MTVFYTSCWIWYSNDNLILIKIIKKKKRFYLFCTNSQALNGKTVLQSPPHLLITLVNILGVLCLTTNELELKNISRVGYYIASFRAAELINFLTYLIENKYMFVCVHVQDYLFIFFNERVLGIGNVRLLISTSNLNKN